MCLPAEEALGSWEGTRLEPAFRLGICECVDSLQGTESDTEAAHSGLGCGWRGVVGPRPLCKSKNSFQTVLELGEHSAWVNTVF